MKTKEEKKGIHFDVVGAQYRMTHDTMRILDELAHEDELECDLEREPNNVADSNAIKVLVTDPRLRQDHPLVFGSDRFFVGYLRRQTATVIGPGMDKGKVKVKVAWLESLNPESGQGVVRVELKRVKVDN